jgi:hypothetical protein
MRYGDNYRGTGKAKQSSTLRIPSWYWASCELPIKTLEYSGLEPEAEVLDVAMASLGLDHFGNVASARLTLIGYLRRMEWRATGTDPAETLFPCTSEKKWTGRFYPDRLLHSAVSAGENGSLSVLLLGQEGYHSTALVIKQLETPPYTYRRVGFLTTTCYTFWSIQPHDIMRPPGTRVASRRRSSTSSSCLIKFSGHSRTRAAWTSDGKRHVRVRVSLQSPTL